MIWDSLVAASRIRRNIKVGQRIPERLFKMGKQRS